MDAIDPQHAPGLKCQVNKAGRYLTNFYTPRYDLSKLGTWQRLERTFTAPPAGDGASLALEKRTTETVTATLHLDDVELTALDAATKTAP